MAESFRLSRKEAIAALRRRWASTRYVQDMVELYAKLEGEFSKDAGEGARGVPVIVLRNEGPLPLDPETFRAAAARWALGPRAPHPEAGFRLPEVDKGRAAGGSVSLERDGVLGAWRAQLGMQLRRALCGPA